MDNDKDCHLEEVEHFNIRDNIVTGATGGGWIEGDGINAGNIDNIRIEGNQIYSDADEIGCFLIGGK